MHVKLYKSIGLRKAQTILLLTYSTLYARCH